MAERSPTLAGAILAAIKAQTKNLRVCLPARVETYDESRREVSVQPLVKDGDIDETGARVVARLPVINHVPVVFPGSGGVRIKFPITKGDTVMLMFSSSSLDRWLALGGEVDPKDDRRHSLADAIAIPGLQPFAGAGADGEGSPLLEFTTDGEIHAGGSDALVKLSEFNSHTHAVATTGTAAAQTGTAAAPTPVTGTTILKGA